MKYAFDWGGTLSNNPELQEIARLLLAAGHEVYVISVAWPHEKREEHLAEQPLKFTAVRVITETGATRHGQEKVRIMRELGCRVIFDDNPEVIEWARAAGFLALKVPYKDH